MGNGSVFMHIIMFSNISSVVEGLLRCTYMFTKALNELKSETCPIVLPIGYWSQQTGGCITIQIYFIYGNGQHSEVNCLYK